MPASSNASKSKEMTEQGLEKLKELEREMRKLRNETEEVHGQLRDLLWNEDESNQQLDNGNACPNNKKDEAIRALSEWAKEDKENRSVLVLADDESDTSLDCNGNGANMANMLAKAMINNRLLYIVCATAMLMCKELETKDNGKAKSKNN